MSQTTRLLLFAALAFGVLILSGCGGSSKPKGFLNPATLEQSISDQLNQKVETATGTARTDLEAEGVDISDRVKLAVCILKANSTREFTCKVTIGDTSDTSDVLVSKDGKRWVTE